LESIITSKLNRLIIPQVDFHGTSLREAVDFLRRKSIELDSTEPDPAQRGVNIVLQFDGTEPDNKITLSLANKSLASVLQSICQAANVKMKVDPYVVSLVPPNVNVEEMITKEYRLLAPFDAKQTAMDFLKARGVTFPAGASTVYFKARRILIVHTTEANIDLIDAMVEKWNAGQAQTSPPAPAATPGANASGGEASPETGIQNKLHHLIIAKLEFRDTKFTDALDYLKKESVELDTTEPDPSKRGVNIIIKPGIAGGRITLSLANIPLIEAIKFVCQLANLKFTISPTAVTVEPVQ
jgi:hypothetical protein